MRTQPPVAISNSPDEVEAALYEALQRGDIGALMAVWTDDDDIVCVHPGGARVVGAAAIRASFEAIFAHGGISVQVQQVHRLEYPDSALHHLMESVTVAGPDGPQQAWVIATNFYIKTARGWRLASHHASPGSLQRQGPVPAATGGEWPSTLH